ncbi:uncharacterized protein LOC143583599 [Bidens hawaiensis]|uniref:uncharacterized protein LOC143583599 n=1 Tax=Bidens hawaiensis TaxID=980011 RepID=UPI00404ABBF9
MDSPSSSDIINRYLKINEHTTDDEAEEEAVTSAGTLAAKYIQSIYSSPQPVLRREYVERDREGANTHLMEDYFVDSPTYKNSKTLRRHFRMSKRLFLRIDNDLEREYDYFKKKLDARGMLGFTNHQNCMSVLCVLSYRTTTDINDTYLKMVAKMSRDTLGSIIQLYYERYLKGPTWHGPQRIYSVHEREHSLPSMIRSIDCMHWKWGNRLTALRGQYIRGDQKVPTVSLQAVVSYDIWVWSAYFGNPRSNNDINVLEASPVVED